MDRIQVAYWWFFARYEIRDNAICPVADSPCEQYDPWELFDRACSGVSPSQRGKRMIDLPFQELFALVREIKNPFGADAKLLANWCSRFGLLGILPHRAHTITLPARWSRPPDNAAAVIWQKFRNLGSRQLVPTVTQHTRTPTGWQSSRLPFAPARNVERLLGAVVTDRDLPSNCPRPGIIWTEADESTPSSASLDVLQPFFQSVRVNDSEYPMPLSPRFWASYCEPIHEFWNAAMALYQSVHAIAHLQHKPLNELPDIEAAMAFRAIQRLNALASPVSVSLGPVGDGSRLVQRWTGPSLISSLSYMALLTLAEGQAHRCAICSSVFVSGAWQAKYCSKRCRDTGLKRGLRLRQKTAIAMRRDGESIKVIALKLGSTVPTVKGWLTKQTPH